MGCACPVHFCKYRNAASKVKGTKLPQDQAESFWTGHRLTENASFVASIFIHSTKHSFVLLVKDVVCKDCWI